MKKLLAVALMGSAIAVTGLLTTSATASAAPSAMMQQQANVGQLLRGLINVNIGAVQADVDTGDITLVNVEDVLNGSRIDILNNAINNNEVASRNQDILNNLLRDADILTDNQVIVGVLTGGQLVFQNVPALP